MQGHTGLETSHIVEWMKKKRCMSAEGYNMYVRDRKSNAYPDTELYWQPGMNKKITVLRQIQASEKGEVTAFKETICSKIFISLGYGLCLFLPSNELFYCRNV